MSQLIIRHDDETREIRYNATEGEEPCEVLFRYVNLMPIEIERIQKGTVEEVQNLLRRYI